ncbi:dNTP triphosphohydrolase [Erysipelothrix sp. HDW6C]|uniref:dGTP triphosphohydrolase n=1 Tax=Erysipelothrix sp. HDW6C TaxID=2714930 RepID=UPI00140CF68E|nr:dNTP triphosphohydrolase [Erysipelothrix sp. HDW6C]QIK70280.1 dNTP triphosphohydrolase [Erysipelothrix sp. HDW6C]
MNKYFKMQRKAKPSIYDRVAGQNNNVLNDNQIDYNTIITSPSFRRMQDKTQVFPLNRGDFVRTRLTHSLEVSNIAEQIARYVLIYNKRNKTWNDNNSSNGLKTFEESDGEILVGLCKNVGLIHDIGNPSFGHFGESCIRDWFIENNSLGLFTDEFGNKRYLKEFINKSNVNYELYNDFLKFDGNVQGIRIVLKEYLKEGVQGMNLSYPLVYSMLKYPFDSKYAVDNKKKKFGYYFAEKELIDEITDSTEALKPRHLVTYILEAADDIAYCIADIEDAFKRGVITLNDIEVELIRIKENDEDDANIHYSSIVDRFDELLKIDGKLIESNIINSLRIWLQEVQVRLMLSVATQLNYDVNKLYNGIETEKYELSKECFERKFFDFARNIASRIIFDNDQILKTEIASKACLSDLMDIFVSAMIAYDANIKVEVFDESDQKYVTKKIRNSYYNMKICALIPEEYLSLYSIESKDKDENYKLYLRVLCVIDFVSGLTDNYAFELRQELRGLN